MSEQNGSKPQQGKSLLAFDVGSIHTRAVLFDLVEGRYRFLAAGQGMSTAGAPLFDASEGIRIALDELQKIAGRAMVDKDEGLIIPSTSDGHGADQVSITYSGGPPLKTVLVGLLDQVSLASITNLAHTTYTDIVEVISLTDHKRDDEQLDNILKINPDVVLIAGGTDKGASNSVLKMVNILGLALHLMPKNKRPDVLFAGNSKLAPQVKLFIERLTHMHVAPNVRPTLTNEQLGPAQAILSDIFREINTLRIHGLEELDALSGGHLMPTSTGLGRVIRFFSKIIPFPTTRGVLGLDIGATATTVAGSFNGDLRLRVFSELGMGSGLQGVLDNSKLEEITRWIPLEVSNQYVLNYIQNKILAPATLPATKQDMAIEQALAREVMRLAIRDLGDRFPRNALHVAGNPLPLFDPIVISGGVVAHAPTPADSLLMILDALQPSGIHQIILDKNNLAPMLGATASINPLLVSQLLLDPTAFLNLGFIISPVSNAKSGVPVVRVRIQYENGQQHTATIHQGNIQKLPLAIGQKAKLYIDPLQRADIGSGRGKSISRGVIGGPFGIVVDARGRPLNLADNPARRRAQLQTWLSAMKK